MTDSITMPYYVFIENNTISGWGQCRVLNEDVTCVETTKAVIDEIDQYIWNGEALEKMSSAAYAEKVAAKHRQLLDSLNLTPSDVERALYTAKSMDFEDLKALIVQNIPSLDIKAIGIEFRAKDFWRGATFNNIRLFDVVGQLLEYTALDMDYLFVTKQLPSNSLTTEEKQEVIDAYCAREEEIKAFN